MIWTKIIKFFDQGLTKVILFLKVSLLSILKIEIYTLVS